MRELASPQPLDRESFEAVFAAMQGGDLTLTHNDKRLHLGPVLGRGGTKTVYATTVAGEKRALALPNIVDGSQTAARKWQNALREPEATEIIRRLGLLVNPCCEITPITIAGTPFSAITSTPYADLPFEVCDTKNPNSSTMRGDIFPTTPTLGSFMEASLGIAQDAAKLVKNGIVLGGDAFNVARTPADGLRLFLNDLSDATLEGEKYAKEYAIRTSARALEALLCGLPAEEYERHAHVFDGPDFGSPGSRVFKDFAAVVLAEAGISS